MDSALILSGSLCVVFMEAEGTCCSPRHEGIWWLRSFQSLHLGICLGGKDLTGHHRTDLTEKKKRKQLYKDFWSSKGGIGTHVGEEAREHIVARTTWLRASCHCSFQKGTFKWNRQCILLTIEHANAPRTFLCLCIKILTIPLKYPHMLVVSMYGKQAA